MDRTQVRISSAALRNNLEQFKQLLPGKKIVGVVKANAYGHGLEAVVKTLEDQVDAWQVDSIAELQQVCQLSQKPVWVLGYVPKENWQDLCPDQAELSVVSINQLQELNQWAATKKVTIKIHLKLDTGFGRLGILNAQLTAFLKHLQKSKHIDLAGVYTHFGQADEPDLDPTWSQISRFEQALMQINNVGYQDLKVHMSATAGSLAYEQHHPHLDSPATHVRLGIGMYGLWPSSFLASQYSSQVELQPVLSWVTQVAQVKTLPVDWPVAYGATFTTRESTQVAILPVGYADGYDRGLSSRGLVLGQGKLCPVIGRVMMNMTVIDVSKLEEEIKVGDEVVLLGQQNDKEITADFIAEQIETINYEVVTRISPLLPREVV